MTLGLNKILAFKEVQMKSNLLVYIFISALFGSSHALASSCEDAYSAAEEAYSYARRGYNAGDIDDQDLLALALQFRGTVAEQLSSFAILERVLRDQFDVVENSSSKPATPMAVVRKPADVPCDTVGNPADPDSSFNAHTGQGYMAQIVETWSDDGADGEGNDTAGASPPI
jgi:hypothetical protein